jgi:stage II sporulation protein AA (anti-sigma F factor antagonist)
MNAILDTRRDGALFVAPADPLAGPQAAVLKTELKPLLRNVRRLVYLSKVFYMDSAGCGALLWAHRELKSQGGQLIVCGITSPVRALFDMLRMASVLTIVPRKECVLGERQTASRLSAVLRAQAAG